jgi:hypothetical protein
MTHSGVLYEKMLCTGELLSARIYTPATLKIWIAEPDIWLVNSGVNTSWTPQLEGSHPPRGRFGGGSNNVQDVSS